MLFFLVLLVLVVVGMIASTMLYIMSMSPTDYQREGARTREFARQQPRPQA